LRDERRSFRRRLTVILGLLALFTAGAVLLFGHLLFESLSKDVVQQALLRTRLDAERIAKGVEERSMGDLCTLEYKQKEIDTFVDQAVIERQVLSEIRVIDRQGRLLYTYKSALTKPLGEAIGLEGSQVPIPPGGRTLPNERLTEGSFQIRDPYSFEVPIGDFGVLRVGVSRKELETRVEKLRETLYVRTATAALVSLLGIAAASSAVILLYRRTQKTEEARAEAERRAELGEVAAGLAHEIRNPLNAMGLNLELLEEQLQRVSFSPAGVLAPAQVTELARAARQETGRLSRLLTDFLAYARPSPIVTVPADLNDPAAEAVAFLLPEARQRDIQLEFVPHPGGARAKLDEARVKQVVLNLVGNALDAVESEGASKREVRVRVEEDGRFWRLTVADHGPGVPKGKEGEVFGAFVSTKPAGTGLGLPIAERIVRSHGGALTLESRPGEPTRAVATFPKA